MSSITNLRDYQLGRSIRENLAKAEQAKRAVRAGEVQMYEAIREARTQFAGTKAQLFAYFKSEGIDVDYPAFQRAFRKAFRSKRGA